MESGCDGKAAAEKEEEEEEEAGQKIRGKRRTKAAWSRRRRTRQSWTFPLEVAEDGERRADGGGSSARAEVKEKEG